MMSVQLQITLIICLLVVAGYIIKLVRHKRIDFKYGLAWLLVELCILILAIWPVLLNKLADMLGIASPMNMLFFFGFTLVVVIIFSLSISVSKLSDRVRKLSQEIAIIRKDMYDNYRELNKKQEERMEE